MFETFSLNPLLKNRSKNFSYLTLYISFLTLLPAETYWVADNCDTLCQGHFETKFPDDDAWKEHTLNITTDKQTFDFKKNQFACEQIAIHGYGFILKAKKGLIARQDKSLSWVLEDNIKLQTEKVFIESQHASFDQKTNSFKSEDVSFVIMPSQIRGKAQYFEGSTKHFELRDVEYTQCPPGQNDWHMYTSSITWDYERDTLQVKNPQLYFFDKPLIKAPTFKVTQNKATNKVITIPHLKFSTKGSLSVRAPMFFNFEKHSLEFSPELSFKYGVAEQLRYYTEHYEVHQFSQLLKFTGHSSWFLGLIGNGTQESVEWDYVGYLMSDPDLVYRYPDLTFHHNKLYAPNRISIKKNTAIGTIQLYSDYLYPFSEVLQNNFEVISLPLSVRLYDESSRHSLLTSFQLLKNSNEGTYQRIYGHYAHYLGLDGKAKLRFNNYLEQGAMQISSELEHELFLHHSANWQLDATILASLNHKTAELPMQDVVALPLTADSLKTLRWHQGEDYASTAAIVTPSVTLEPTAAIKMQMIMAFAIKKPGQLWQNQFIYATPFYNQQFYSPLGLKASYGQKWNLNCLIDVYRKELLTTQLEHFFSYERFDGYGSIFFHRYFPIDRLGAEVINLKQITLGIQSKLKSHRQFFLESAVNLDDVELDNLRIGIIDDRCCWQSVFGFSAQKDYDPITKKRQYNLGISFKIEVKTIGFMRVGKSDTLQFRGLRKNPYLKNHGVYSC